MPQIRRYYGVAHVRWELPFPTRLVPRYLSCWEPDEGTALLLCLPRVETVMWRRQSPLVNQQELLGERFVPEPSWAVPNYGYQQSSEISTGSELFTTELISGERGGFDEVHAYTIANVFLCLRSKSDQGEQTFLRAAAVINNVLSVHALLTADGWTRPIRPSLDAYMTMSSVATVPDGWPQLSALALLHRIEGLSFATEIGKGRTAKIGAGSHDDLLQGAFDEKNMALLAQACEQQFDLAVYQQLMLCAFRRVGRREYAAAIIDAQSAAELCVASFLRRVLLAKGQTEEEVAIDFDGRLAGLGPRIDELERHAQAGGATTHFNQSPERTRWNRELANLRHGVVHRGVREITFEQARQGISAGMGAIAKLEEMWPQFQPPMRWAGDYLKVEHLRETAGKLYRLFDA